MAAQINTNLYSLNAQRNLSKNSMGLQSAIERLSSGLRVNSAKDDAAGLAVALGQDSAARGISASIRNSSDQISQAQIADGALQVVGDILLRMSELESQAASTTLNSTQKGYIQTEFAQLSSSITNIQGNAKLNGATAFAQGISSVTTVSTTAGASAAAITSALDSVAANRATAGAVMNNLQFQIQSFEVNYENTMAAKSRVMDADFAAETANLSRFQILQQAGTAMVAQANSIPQNVLSLLR
mgnify:CR=1 FL=1